VLGLIDLHIGGEAVKLLALTRVLFADASRISFPALRSEFAVPARLLGVGLPLTIAAGTLVGVGVLPGVSLVEALVLSIMLACTDAALGQAVVTDERIPSRIRQGLNVESGLNDGICVPPFFIALVIAEAEEGTTTAHAAAHLVLEEIGYGLVGGIAAGVLGAFALRVATRRSLVEPHWLQILTAATALLAAGIATGLGGSIFIAAFTGGFLFGVVGRDSGGEVSYLVDEGGELLNAVTFIVFGAALTARRASSSCAAGTPKTAITASPMNFSTVPPWRSSASRASEKYSSITRRSASGSSRSPNSVEPETSANTTVTVFRASAMPRVYDSVPASSRLGSGKFTCSPVTLAPCNYKPLVTRV
jgi:NhaP-type Na+/H+ or K+/H+ antiporter